MKLSPTLTIPSFPAERSSPVHKVIMSATKGTESSSRSTDKIGDGQRRFERPQSHTASGSDEQQTTLDESKHNKSKESRRARRPKAGKSKGSITTAEIEQGMVKFLSESPSLAEIEGHMDLTYTNRFNKAAKYLQVADHVKVLKPTVDALEMLLCAGPTRGRQYSVSCTLDSFDSESWVFRIINNADSNDRVCIGTSKKDYSFTISVDSSVAPEEASGRLVAERLCRIFVCVTFMMLRGSIDLNI